MYAQRKKLQRKYISPNCFILNYPQGENNILPHPFTLNVCTKSILRIHSVQHYYRNASRKGHAQRNQSFFVHCVEIEFRHRSPDRPATKTNLFFMFIAFVCFSPLGHGIRCNNLSGSLFTRRFWQLSTVRAQLKSAQKGFIGFCLTKIIKI